MIRAAMAADIVEIARIHSVSLAETIMSKMGLPILSKLYSALLGQPSAKIYLDEEKGEVVGIASWALSYKIELDKNTKKEIVKQIFKYPTLWMGVIERALTGQYIKLFFGYEPWLLTLAVAEEKQGSGVGTKLVEKIFAEVRLHGRNSLLVETLIDKDKVVQFYEKLGFVRVKKIGPNIILRKTL